jgi:myosin heavy subunit
VLQLEQCVCHYPQLMSPTQVLEFTVEEVEDVLRIVAAVLHLGDLEFTKAEGGSIGQMETAVVKNEDTLKVAAKLLHVPHDRYCTVTGQLSQRSYPVVQTS